MISVAQAQEIINAQTLVLPNISVPLMESLGKTLAEDILADRDFPPFNRVTMDGIAIDFQSIQNNFWPIQNRQLAGQDQLNLEAQNQAIEVMTGAMLPLGTDTVIRYEDIDIEEVNGKMIATLTVNFEVIKQGQNIHKQGSDAKKGDCLITKNTKISSPQIAVMASVGKDNVLINASPKIAIIATGNELVEIEEKPLPHQIRKSNSYMLEAILKQHGLGASLFHLQDDIEELESKLGQLLQNFDVLILSGGVSEGKADFIPQVLENLNVKKHFHKIAQRPGKPFWFGTGPTQQNVFALPGNPVSTYVCFLKYVLPTLIAPKIPQFAVLIQEISFKPTLTYFVPVWLSVSENGQLQANPQLGNGSGDFANLLKANALIELPANKSSFEIGEVYPVISF